MIESLINNAWLLQKLGGFTVDETAATSHETRNTVSLRATFV